MRLLAIISFTACAIVVSMAWQDHLATVMEAAVR